MWCMLRTVKSRSCRKATFPELYLRVKTDLGLDSHRFVEGGADKAVCWGAGFEDVPALAGNSDADVVHALTDAISGVPGTR